MYKLNMLIAKNKAIAWLLISAFEISVFWILLSSPEFSSGFIAVLSALFMLYNLAFVHSAQGQLMKKPLKALSDGCDPEPLLKVTEELLQGKQNEANRQVLLINKAAALREMGELAKAFDILSAVNIDKIPGTLPITKFVYYNNLSDLCYLLDKPEEGRIWYTKLMQIYNDIPEGKTKLSASSSATLATADDCYRKGEFDKALSLLNTLGAMTAAERVSTSLLRGMICLRGENRELAKTYLNDVINNGNKLYAVTVANNLLANIEE
ncbi:MAG: tetratricopeptide repeat protein [Ruminococcaceae bacterium]|nr:tetratricopeptide repeat protein [Oscillospiraceae bacterium]